METDEARAMSTSDLECLTAAKKAVQWFKDDDNTVDCLDLMQEKFQRENDDEYYYMAQWLSEVMKVDSYQEFKELSNQSCIEWITFSMAEDGHSCDDIRTALRLVGDNPLGIDWIDV